MATREGNRKAKNNGDMCEQFIGIHNNKNSLIDDPDRGYEVKGCLEWRQAYKIDGKTLRYFKRRGHFVFYEKQHNHLLKTNGKYVLVVHDGVQVIRHKIIPAKNIDYLLKENANGKFRRFLKWSYIFME